MQVRELLNLTPEQLNEQLPEEVVIQFDEGAFTLHKPDVVLSSVFWKFHRAYPKLPLLYTHTLPSIMNGEPFGSKTHKKLMEVITHDLYSLYGFNHPNEIANVKRIIFQVNNDLDNVGSMISEEYPLDIDIDDFLDIVEHPEYAKILADLRPDSFSISKFYEKLDALIKTHPDFRGNNLVWAIRCGLVNSMQTYQCTGVRGIVTEVNSTHIPTPVMTNYTRGMYKHEELTIESRSGAKSLYLTDAALEDSEYFARRLQLLCMVVRKIVYHDCGSTHYQNWTVKGPIYDESGVCTYPGDLNFMKGKYYLDEETGTLKTIRNAKKDKHLIGKVIKLRHVRGCIHEKADEICHVCFGALAFNLPAHANIGYVSAADMTKQATQGIMSNKHLDKSSSGGALILDNMARTFLEVNPDRISVRFKEKYSRKRMSIIVPAASATGLVGVVNATNVNDIHPPRASSITNMTICIFSGDTETQIPIMVNKTRIPASLTMDFLMHVKAVGYKLDSNNNFVISLDGWDYDRTVMEIPEMEYNQAEHNAQISMLIESSMKEIQSRAKPESYQRTLEELFMLVNSKLSVQLSCLETIMYATSIYNQDSYDLSRGSDSPILGIGDDLIKGRSMATSLAYEDILPSIYNPDSTIPYNRPNSPMDVFVCPQETIQDVLRG